MCHLILGEGASTSAQASPEEEVVIIDTEAVLLDPEILKVLGQEVVQNQNTEDIT